mmetsp:Transcript_84655/g.236254  ORF Transcript_84655/g.236254 Transcript_84655/m.236254 type:complete len:362 (-) Transcript_84655:420-1505(-)
MVKRHEVTHVVPDAHASPSVLATIPGAVLAFDADGRHVPPVVVSELRRTEEEKIREVLGLTAETSIIREALCSAHRVRVAQKAVSMRFEVPRGVQDRAVQVARRRHQRDFRAFVLSDAVGLPPILLRKGHALPRARGMHDRPTFRHPEAWPRPLRHVEFAARQIKVSAIADLLAEDVRLLDDELLKLVLRVFVLIYVVIDPEAPAHDNRRVEANWYKTHVPEVILSKPAPLADPQDIECQPHFVRVRREFVEHFGLDLWERDGTVQDEFSHEKKSPFNWDGPMDVELQQDVVLRADFHVVVVSPARDKGAIENQGVEHQGSVPVVDAKRGVPHKLFVLIGIISVPIWREHWSCTAASSNGW